MKTLLILLTASVCLLTPARMSAQPVSWNGSGDGVSWSNPQNWVGGQVPGPTSSVFITNGEGGNVIIASPVSVESVVCDRALTITNGSLAVTAGASTVEGTLTITTLGTLSASGAGTTFTSSGPVVGSDGNFTVAGGAVMSLPGLLNYTKACDGANWSVSGASSVLELPGLTNISGAACSYPTIQAEEGGQILATNLVSIQAGPLAFQADGTNSLIDFASLTTCAGQTNYLVTFEASDGGTMNIPKMTGGPLVGVTVNSNSTLQVAQIGELTELTINGGAPTFPLLTNMAGGLVVISGVTVSLPALTDINDGNFTVSGGASVTLPALRNYTKNCNGGNWTVTGSNSVLDLAVLTNITGAACTYPTIQAEAGGQILAPNVVSILAGPLAFDADGSNSFINLSSLTSCSGVQPYLLTFEAGGGGTIEMPHMTGGPLVGITFNPSSTLELGALGQLSSITINSGAISFPALTNMSGGLVTATGGSMASFPALTNIDDGNFDVSGGASVTLTALRNYTKNCNGGNWTVTGSNSVLDLAELTNMTGAACSYPTIEAETGGQILAPNVVSIEAGPQAFQADGTNSLINLSALTQCNGQGGYLVTFEVSAGGTMEIPNLTGGNLVGVTINSISTFEAGHLAQLNSITVNGGAYTLPSLTNVSSGAIVINGATVNFPALTSFAGAQTSLEAINGATVIAGDLGSVANVTVTIDSTSTMNLASITNLSGCNLTVNTCPATFTNVVNLSGASITVNGCAVTLSNATDIDNASFVVNSGGSLSMPGAGIYNQNVNYSTAFQANGAGSVLSLGGLTNVTGLSGNYFGAQPLHVEALGGGRVEMGAPLSFSSGEEEVLAEGSNSVVDLSGMTSFYGYDGNNGSSSLQPLDGGTILAGSLGAASGVNAYLGDGTLNLNSATNFTYGSLTITNGVLTLPNLADIDNSSLYVSDGATLSLSSVGNYNQNANYTTVFQANGSGSLLSLAGLTNVTGLSGNYFGTYPFLIQALNGGRVNLHGLVSFSGGEDEVLAQGTNSLVNLSSLASFSGYDGNLGNSSLQATSGGAIQAGQAGNITGVTLSWTPTSTLNVGGVTNLSYSVLSVSVGTVVLSNVVDIDNASLYVSNGATLSLPIAGIYNQNNGSFVTQFQATGAGSVLSLAGLTNVTGLSGNYYGARPLQIQALSGGEVEMPAAGESFSSGVEEVLAQGSNSVVNLSGLTSFYGYDGAYGSSSMQPLDGGTILLGPLGIVSGVNAYIGDGTMNLNAATNFSDGALTITNGALTLTNLADIDDSSLYVSDGASLSLPAVGIYNQNSGSSATMFQAAGPGSVLSLNGLTNVTGLTGNYYGAHPLQIQAQDGGRVNLDALSSFSSGVEELLAEGTNSLINLPGLQSFYGYNAAAGSSSLQAASGGTIQAGEVGSVNGVSVSWTPASTLNLNGATNLSYSTLSVSAGALVLSNVVDIDNADLYVSSGATLSLPAVGIYNQNNGSFGTQFQVTGTSSVLSLAGLTNVTGLSGNYYGAHPLQIQALGGGEVEMPALEAFSSGENEVLAQGTNSLVNLSDLTSFYGYDGADGVSSLEATQNGTIVAGALGVASGVNIYFEGGALSIDAVTNLTSGSVTIISGALTLSNVSDIDDSSLFVSGGATLSLPEVADFNHNAYTTPETWLATNSGSILSLNGLTNISGTDQNNSQPLYVDALGGGEVSLARLFSISNSPVQVSSTGNGSVVNLSSLVSYSVAITSLAATDGGVIVQSKPVLLITANNASMTYGGSVPSLSVSYSGFTNGDTPASLATQPTVSTTGTSLSHAGSYPITAIGAVDTNYTILYVQGTLTINPAPLTITPSNAAKTYGQTAALPATAFSAVGLLNGDTIASVTLTSSGAAPTAGVASYPIFATNATGPRAANYFVTYNTATLTVNPAPLTITAHNATKYFGKTLTFLGTEFTAAGLQNGETVGSVTLTSSGAASTAAVAGSPYLIVPTAASGGTFSSGNYAISYVDGSLTVLPVGSPPSIGSVLPEAGPNTGGTTVTINGANFEPGAAVTFGTLPADGVTFESSNVLTAITPASPSGTVGVTVTNPDGNSITAPGAFAFGNAPEITSPPSSVLVSPGQTAEFEVGASGDPTLAYQWQFNGSNIAGATTSSLNVANAQVANDGYYQCLVTNRYAAVTSAAATLTVVLPPSQVVVSPASLTVGQGGSATLTVTNSGTAPFSYYWYQNGVLISGQTTAVLNIASVQASANYTVVVSNISGTATSAPVALTLAGYCINGSPTQSTYPEGTNIIPINVTTYNCGTDISAPNSAAVVWLSIAGTTRNLLVFTDGSGNGTAYFSPLPVEVGLVQYGFALPGQGAPAYVGSFTIIGMNLSAQSETPQLVVGQPQTNTLLLNNLTAVPLSGITATVIGAPANVKVNVSVPPLVEGNSAIQTTYTLEATGTSPSVAQFSIQYTSAQGATVTLPFTATISPPTALLASTPGSLVGTMINNHQTLITFSLTNIGGAASGPLQVDLPPTSWLSVATAQPLPSLNINQGGQVTLSLLPTNGQQLGEYTGDIVIQGSNTALTVPFAFTDVSTLKGNLEVTVEDELTLYDTNHPNLSNATVTVTDFVTGTNVGTQVTGSNGIVTFSNLTSAYYTVSVEAPDHGTFGTTLLVAANTTTPVTAFLPMNLVDYTWVVTPTTIADTYDYTLTTTFVTEVPWPEITVDPVDLCTLPDCTNQYNLVVHNYGLIAAEGLQVVINNSNPYWSFNTLITNLGNLAAESSLTIPVVLTRLGCETNAGGPTSIDAQLIWYVAALNGTKYYSTPLFIYNANCVHGNAGSPPVTYGGPAAPSGGVSIAQPVNYSYTPTNGAIVNVTLQIDQTSVLTANAFHATLNLTNGASTPITDLQVNITGFDTNGNPATNAFFVGTPNLYGINAVDGTGSLAPGVGGQADWTIIPTTNAAPLGSSNYGIGGSISYVYEGQQVTIPLFPVPVTVLPEPQLYLDYFLQHDVYSQDPFTSVVEPPIPFALGLRVRNLGYGIADDFTITSAQPTIINNANGLLINFQIIASQVGASATPVPSLTLNMGDIDPGTNAVGIWWMTASLEGDFTNFQATFQHLDSLGGQETSLVSGVKIHEMNHVVEITCPDNDGIPDFLCNDTTNVDALPDDVYSSDGNVYPVTSLTGATSTGTVSGPNSTITVSDVADNIPSGFVYFQLDDPSGGQYAITSVKRSDGVELLVGTNVWQTPYRPNMVPPQLHNLIHIFDCNSTGSYTVTFGTAVAAPDATTLAAQDVSSTNATLVGLINPESGSTEYYFQWGLNSNYTAFTPTNWLTAELGFAQEVTAYINNLAPSTTIHYRVVAINAEGTNYGADETLGTAALLPPVIEQVPDQFVIVGQTLGITNSAVVATPPATYSLAGAIPEGASISPSGIFIWQPTCQEGSTTNVITVWATDSGSPPLSNSMTFTVTVGECVQIGLGSTTLKAGQSGSVPVNLFSTVGITNLSFSLDVPSGRFTNFTITPSNSAIASASVSTVGGSPFFTLSTQPGESLPSPSLLGSIGFTALPGDSAFISAAATNIIGYQFGGIGVGNVTSLPGEITIVGFHPLLSSVLSGNSSVTLTLYGTPGSNYVMAYTTNLASTNWQTGSTVLLTNIQQNVTVPITASNLFFRLQ